MLSTNDLCTLVSCIDLTSLNTDDTPERIAKLCDQAVTPLGHVAAVCIYPAFVSQAWQQLMKTPVKIATVVNFPGGSESVEKITQTLQQAILGGASEIDAVIPQNNNTNDIINMIKLCKKLCGDKAQLKIILETGHKSPEEIKETSQIAVTHGADFLKTSTGKINIGATPEAAKIMLEVIKNAHSSTPIGFKASGGVKTVEQAEVYVHLAKTILGDSAFSPEHFRIGASSLLKEILCAFPSQS
jgi:deoxyribose-phosphate aldolase